MFPQRSNCLDEMVTLARSGSACPENSPIARRKSCSKIVNFCQSRSVARARKSVGLPVVQLLTCAVDPC